ncbi:hypothetical protein KKE92_00320 [Candidatus Micrarchaeota archaeon]|nr:hypothetical protein [Candidatus Micrarchaeota archaeon]MBU1682017.1 hypothetical protein [Candidatus Micrarchaeota archaeon]
MKSQSHYRGAISFDTLFSIIPILMIFVLLFQSIQFIGLSTEESSRDQDLFDKLVLAADYTVKSGAAVRDGNIRYPNWIEEGKISSSYSEGLRMRYGLNELFISLDTPEESSMCIYRMVVYGNSKKISKLFVCGD